MAEAGRFGEAVATGQKALELAERSQEPALAGLLRARIALYRARRRVSQEQPSDTVRRRWRAGGDRPGNAVHPAENARQPRPTTN